MKRFHILIALSAALVVSAPNVRAQDQGSGAPDASGPISPLPAQDNGDSGDHQAPAPAGRALSGIISSDSDQSSGQVQPDDTALLGAEIIGLGSLSGTTTVFDPAFRFSQGADNGIVEGHYDSVTSIGGSLAVNHNWGRYHLAMQYSGAMIFYAPDSSLSVAYHNFGIGQDVKWKRWALHLRDSLSVSPQSNYGGLYTGSTGLAGQTTLLNTLAPTITLGETVETGQVTQANNTVLAEVDYLTTPRSSISISGSYGLLHYFTAGYIDDRQTNGGIAYNYHLSASNTIAVAYSFSRIDYSGAGIGATQTHLIGLGYGRRITGRLGFQISAGPQYIETLNTGPGAGQNPYWTWSVSGSLTYAFTRATSVNLSYTHGASNGSGVFAGSENDTVGAGINHRFSRFLTVSANGGYAYTASLVPAGVDASHYGNWYAGANLSRQFGREIGLYGSYGYQQQSSGSGVCPVLSCGLPAPSRNVVSVTVEWHPWAVQQPR